MSAKASSKSFAQQKRHRRQWLTFMRMCRYGVNNFSRNAWLTIAATAVMTITLLIIFVTFIAQNVLQDSVKEVSKRVDMSIYLKNSTTDDQAKQITDRLEKLSNVDSVSYINPEKAREDFLSKNKSDTSIIEALRSSNNQFLGTIRIKLKNINNTSQLEDFVKQDQDLKKYISDDRKPSFAGERREAIQNLARGTDFAQRLGLIASVIFIAISSLIVFNTIRMAIFNRKEEIQMMKLIGADRSFIRGPFVVEAIVYGAIAAVLATGLGILLLILSADKMGEYGVTIKPTIELLTTYLPFVLLGMVLLGSMIGTISSLLATRRYLKI